MNLKKFYKYIDLNYYSATPKYLQLANAITKAIDEGKLTKGDMLPSINELSYEFEISRDTAEKGYKHLKNIGILSSVAGKGYFVKDTEVDNQLKILMLFNKLSPHKKVIYDSFVANITPTAAIDFFIYNNDFAVFKRILSARIDNYTHYLVMPHFKDGGENAYELLNAIPKHKLIVVDKYHTMKIVCLEYAIYPKEIVKGFLNFCRQYAFNYVVIKDLHSATIEAGDVFITHMENDLVELIEKILASNLQVGKEVGVISYNESPLKRIILNGITTISTDFQQMGERAAKAVLDKSTTKEEMPFNLNLRASL